MSQQLQRITWCPQVFCTANFATTIVAAEAAQTDYLRPVTSMLWFPGEETCLLGVERGRSCAGALLVATASSECHHHALS